MQKKYIMEGRLKTGELDCKNEPPFLICTLDQIAKYYYKKNPGENSESWDVIKAWYTERGWYWREKTW